MLSPPMMNVSSVFPSAVFNAASRLGYTSVAKNTVLRLMNEGEDWDQVATDDGYIGYVQKKKVRP